MSRGGFVALFVTPAVMLWALGAGSPTGHASGADSRPSSRPHGLGLLDTLAPNRHLRKSTLDHDHAQFAAALWKTIVIGAGRAPGGPRYELVAYAAKTPQGMLDSVGGAKVATCMDADFPSLGEPANRDRVCFGGDNISALYLYGLTERRNFGRDLRNRR
jgi:hypothetical protein